MTACYLETVLLLGKLTSTYQSKIVFDIISLFFLPITLINLVNNNFLS